MFSSAYKRYALILLTSAYGVTLLDRGLMFMLLQSIKEDLQLSDTQLGFVNGIAFAVFYATLGVPIARWADRGNRINIISLALAVWSMTVMVCLFVTNFVQFMFSRILAGIGDSGCRPPMYSVLGDYFPEPAERTRAMYINEMCSPVVGLLTFFTAGWMNETFGWRMALFLAGVPGLLMAVIVKWTLVEPPRQHQVIEQAPPTLPPFRSVLRFMWQQQSCRHLTIAMVLIFTMGQGLMTWQTAFMIRQHGMGTTELGLWMGMIHGVGSTVGLLAGSYVLTRWFAHNERGQMRLAAFAAAASVPFYVSFLMLPGKHQALIVLIPQALVYSAFLPATLILLQRLVPDETRATVLMIMMFFANMIGMGVGPQLVGMLSDLLRSITQAEALREAMLLVSFLGFWAAYHLWRVAGTIHTDLIDTGGARRSLDAEIEAPVAAQSFAK